MRLMPWQNPLCASVERSPLTHTASFAIVASPVVLVLLALIGAHICVLALLALAFLGSVLILTNETLETKPHMVLFNRQLRWRSHPILTGIMVRQAALVIGC